jgi:uncharacterized protein
MRYALVIMLSSLLATAALAAAVPSDASIRELLESTHARALLDNVAAQVDARTRADMAEAVKGRTLSDKQKQILDDLQNQLTVIVKGSVSWDNFEPMLLRIYRESFSQDEVDDMLKFYKTPAGQAVVNKMPMVMQNTMQEVQAVMQKTLQKIAEVQKEAEAKMRAASTSQSGV